MVVFGGCREGALMAVKWYRIPQKRGLGFDKTKGAEGVEKSIIRIVVPGNDEKKKELKRGKEG